MKIKIILHIVLIAIVLFLGCTLLGKKRIYNEGTAYKLPSTVSVSDWYNDLSNIYEYCGRNQEYFAKINSFSYSDSTKSIKSVLLFGKRIYNANAEYDYLFLYRRYYQSDHISDKATRLPVVNILKLTIDNEEAITLYPSYPKYYPCDDGIFEEYKWSIYNVSDKYETIVNDLICAKKIVFELPAFEFHNFGGAKISMEPFYEFKMRAIELKGNDLLKVQNDIIEKNKIKRKDPKEYIEYAQKQMLK